MDSHIYEALHVDQTRLLTILPNPDFNTPISCSLSVIDIRSPVEYEALSYVWGDPKITQPIRLSEHEIYITTNLETALHYLRKPDEPRVLWVDAVCINQKDLDERSFQVRMMAEIFSGAHAVIVWLGDLDARVTNVAFDAVEKMHKALTQHPQKYQRHSEGSTTVTAERSQSPHKYPQDRHHTENSKATFFGEKIQRELAPDLVVKPNIENVIGFFNLTNMEVRSLMEVFCESPWWTRLWVVQEVAFANIVMIASGCRAISWEKLPSAPKMRSKTSFSGLGNLLPIFIQADARSAIREELSAIREGQRDIKESYFTDISRLLTPFGHLNCSEPRDKIYAILNISEKAKNQIIPDYYKSLSQLSLEAVRLIIEQTKNLDVLCSFEYDSPERRQFLRPYEAYRQIGQFYGDNDGPKLKAWLDGELDDFSDFRGLISPTDVLELQSQLDFDRNNMEMAKKGSYLTKNEEIIPSWLPNITHRPHNKSVRWYGEGPRRYKPLSCEEVNGDIFHDKLPWLLKLNVVIFDRIIEQSPRMHTTSQGWKSIVSAWRTKTCQQTQYPTGQRLHDVFLRTLLQNHGLTGEQLAESDIDFHEALLSAWLESSVEESYWSESDEIGPCHEDTAVRQFSELLSRTLSCRYFCRTSQSYIGIVGGYSEPGDLLCVAQGASVPIVLRQQHQNLLSIQEECHTNTIGCECFSQAGVAYIHGIMHGEMEHNSQSPCLMKRIYLV